MKSLIILVLFCSTSLFAKNIGDCEIDATLTCQVEYVGLKSGENQFSVLESKTKSARIEYMNTGEPSTDACYAQVSFNHNSAYIMATLDEKMTVGAYGTQGVEYPGHSETLEPGHVFKFSYKFNPTVQINDDQQTVHYAQLSCSVQ